MQIDGHIQIINYSGLAIETNTLRYNAPLCREIQNPKLLSM